MMSWRKVAKAPGIWLLLTIFASVAVRVLAAAYIGNEVTLLPGTYDQLSYHNLALRILDGHGFSFAIGWWPITPAGEPTAHWSYLYTFYLTAVYWIFGPNPLVARLIQAAAVGVLQPVLAFLLARRLVDARTGLIAAGLTAVYAYFVYYAGTLMTEPFYITSILGSLYLTIAVAETEGKKRIALALLLGVTLGATILLRQLFLLFLPVLVIWLWWSTYRHQHKLPLAATAVALGTVIAMIIPFTIYNYLRFDQFVLLNTNSGYAFYWANHPVYGTQFEPLLPAEMGNYPDLIPEEIRGLSEAALDSELLRLGLGFVTDDPGRYIQLSLSRIPIYFMFWPSAESSTVSNIARVLSFGVLWPFMLVGIWLSLRLVWHDASRRDALILLLLFAIFYALIHLLSWSLIRYRLPVDAVLLVPAAVAVAALLDRLPRLTSSRHYQQLPEH